jgi:hypothetical protein
VLYNQNTQYEYLLTRFKDQSEENEYMAKLLDTALFSRLLRNKFFPVFFDQGMRGNAFCSILQAHPEVYYLPDNSIYKSDTYFKTSQYDSLATEDEICVLYGVNKYENIYKYASFKNIRNRIHHLPDTSILPYIVEKHYKNKLLFQLTHYDPVQTPRQFMDTIIQKVYDSDRVFIHMYGTVNRPLLRPLYIDPVNQPNAFNVNIDMLFSTNYNDFTSEYNKIINYFNLTSQIDRVWNYIIKTLERQEFLRKYHKPGNFDKEWNYILDNPE